MIIPSYLQQSGVRLHDAACDSAFYRPSDDTVVLPLQPQFRSTAEYYSTAFHKLTHSTGHNSAAYIQNWLQVLKNDKRFIVSAAGKAEKGRSLRVF